MWLVTGDTHGLTGYDAQKIYPNYLKAIGINIEDIEGIIICGDFGGIWKGTRTEFEYSVKKKLGFLPYKICFVDGNHENHTALGKFPIETWHGGKIHVILDNVYHLMRGQIYNVNGKTWFVMGGATSIDKEWREPDITWWHQEIPSLRQWQEARNNLNKVDWKVDYVFTHCAPTEFMLQIIDSNYKAPDDVTDELQKLYEHPLKYIKWYCGHYHTDKELVQHSLIALYNHVIELK